ncbi:hypothetical protein [Comamonas serinivorans]|nr:hypothetical protein [Comamonas serinivorans]
MAWATHGRSMDLHWSVPDAADPLTVQFELSYVVRASFYGPNPPATLTHSLAFATDAGAGLGSRPITVRRVGQGMDATGADGRYLVYRGTVTYRFSAMGIYTARFSHCCRPSNLANGNNDKDQQVIARVVLDNAQRSGPLMAVPPVINLTAGALNTLSFPMLDPDGDATQCRFATPQEAGDGSIVTQPRLGSQWMTLTNSDNTCTLTWDLRGVVGNSFHALPLVLESTHNGQVSAAAVDRYVIVTDRHFPICTGGGQIALQPNQVFATRFEASGNSDLVFSTIGAPASGSFSPAVGSTGSSPMAVDFGWTPTTADAGNNFIFQAVFRDATNIEGYCNYVINVDTRNPDVSVQPVADVLIGRSTVIQGQAGNVAANQPVDLTLTDSQGQVVPLSALVQADGRWQVTAPGTLAPGVVTVQVRLRHFNVLPASTQFEVLVPAIQMDPIADVVLGSAVALHGTVTPAFDGTMVLTFTDSAGQTHTLTTPLSNGAWQASGPAQLPGGPVSVRATVQGMAAVPAAQGSFEVRVPMLSLNPVADVDAGVAPQLSGSSTEVLSGTVDVQLTDARGQTRTVSVPLQGGVWSLVGPTDLPVGPVDVQVSLQGMAGVVPATGQFRVLAIAAPAPVPVNAGWALGLLGAVLAAWGARRRPIHA